MSFRPLHQINLSKITLLCVIISKYQPNLIFSPKKKESNLIQDVINQSITQKTCYSDHPLQQHWEKKEAKLIWARESKAK